MGGASNNWKEKLFLKREIEKRNSSLLQSYCCVWKGFQYEKQNVWF